MVVTIRASALSTRSGAFIPSGTTGDVHIVGTFYVNASNRTIYAANGTAAGVLTTAGYANYERKLPNIARGDYVVIE